MSCEGDRVVSGRRAEYMVLLRRSPFGEVMKGKNTCDYGVDVTLPGSNRGQDVGEIKKIILRMAHMRGIGRFRQHDVVCGVTLDAFQIRISGDANLADLATRQ